jgi:hypothetical protein
MKEETMALGDNTQRLFEGAYAVQQILVEAGFSSDDIFVGAVDDVVRLGPFPAMHVTNLLTVALRMKDREFRIPVVRLPEDLTHEEINAHWMEFATAITEGKFSEEELVAMKERTGFYDPKTFFRIISVLKTFGFTSPLTEALDLNSPMGQA